ncbi:MAG: hypothetical protein GF315_14420 [candidate division Zixibacteria bacterium]|nr:hypothetical protein [candidate division Zixibacteria bacterium]
MMDRLNRFLRSIGGFALILGVIALIAAVAVFLSGAFELTPAQKSIYIISVVTVIALSLGIWVIYPLVKRTNYSFLARRVEIYHPELKDTLSASVELKRNLDDNPEGYSLEFIRAATDYASERCAGVNFNRCLDKRELLTRVKWASGLIVAVLIIAVIYPSGFLYALKDFSNPSVKFDKPDPFSIAAIPGNTEILKGDDITIGASFIANKEITNGKVKPEEVKFLWAYADDENLHSMPMKSVESEGLSDSALAGAAFSIQMKKVNQSFDYYLVSSDIRSPRYTVSVVNKPRIIDLKQKLVYPNYTGLPPSIIDENDGNITALPGTNVTLTIESNKLLETGKLVFESAGEMPLEIKDNTAAVDFRIKSDDNYHIEIADADGLTNPDPITYNIYALPDANPEVEIIQPGEDIVIGDVKELPLLISARDDFGFNKLNLTYQVKSSGIEQPVRTAEIPLSMKNEQDIAVNHRWDITGLGLIPGDEATYYVTITDNDRYSGYKKAESRRYSIRFPSVDEILTGYDTRREENITDIEKAVANQDKLNREVEEIRREMMRLKESDWEKNKRVQEAIDKQNAINQALDDIKESIQKNQESAEQNKLNSMEILEKSQRISELLEEINSPELMEALRKLQEAMEKLDQNQLKEALENLEFSQEEYLEKLEKTLDMLKRLRAEQKFDQLRQLANKMKDEQENIEKSLEDTESQSEMERLAEQQDNVSEDLESFNEGLDKMQDFNEETPVMPEEDLAQLKQQADSSGLREDMQQASEQMKQGNKNACSGSCQSASQKLSQLASSMESMWQQMQSGQNQEMVRIARKAFNDVLYVSQNQETLFDDLALLSPRDSTIREIAPPQHNLSQKALKIRVDLDSLYKMEPRIGPAMSNELAIAAGKMQDASRKLETKNKAASVSQEDALKYLNRVGFRLLQLLKQANQGGMCSGGACQRPNNQSPSSQGQLSALAGQQRSLNAKTSELAQQLRRSSSQSDAMARMAAEQEAIKEGLRQLLQESEEGSEGRLGRLDDMGEEMREVVDDFERGMVNRNTLMRQERILTRLLDAQKSLQTQGYKEERKAEAGDDIMRLGPDGLASTESDIHGNLKRLQEALNEDYPLEYRQMIKAYINSLSDKLTQQRSIQ